MPKIKQKGKHSSKKLSLGLSCLCFRFGFWRVLLCIILNLKFSSLHIIVQGRLFCFVFIVIVLVIFSSYLSSISYLVLVARFDFSWGDPEYHQETLENLKAAIKSTKKLCAVTCHTFAMFIQLLLNLAKLSLPS